MTKDKEKEKKICSICNDFYEWPDSWKYEKEDIVLGLSLIRIYEPFILEMIAKPLAKKTIKNHIDNLWLLGGEIIRRLNMYDENKDINMLTYLDECIDSEGGPYTRDIDSEYGEMSYDATCRKLYKYLQNK